MGAIEVRHFAGGRRVQNGGSNGSPDLASLLRDIADDLAGVQGGAVPALTATAPSSLTAAAPAALTSSAPGALTSSQNATTNAAVQSGSYVQADVQTIATLGNALKVSYNALQVDVAALRTTLAAAVVDLAALRTPTAATVIDVVALRTTLAAVVVDLAASRTAVNGAQSYTLKTTKA